MCSGALVSGYFGSKASEEAAAAQMMTTMAAIAEQKRQYNQTREDQMPWMTAGKGALNRLSAKIEAGPGQFKESPGYQFRVAEGEKAILRNAAATGGTQGGRTMKALTKYGQDYATNDYDNFLRRYYESLNPDQSMAGIGQTSAASIGSLGNQSSNTISNMLTQSGNNQATGIMNQANAWTGAYNTAANNISNYGMYRQWQNNQAPAANNSANTYNTATISGS